MGAAVLIPSEPDRLRKAHVLRFDDEAMSAATCRFLQRGRAVRAPIAGGGNGECVVVSAECFRYVPRAFRSRISPPTTRMLGRPKLVLASGSPRRLGLLNQAGIEPDALRPADVDETPKRGELPRACANRLARAKADAALKSVHLDDELRGSFILAADTVVAVGRRILPKANLVDEASQCLRLLSGRNHRVYTAICLVTPREAFRQRLIETRVRFKRLSEDDIQAYIGSGEWRGKAGGYAVQGIAGSFVVKMVGSYTNIVGLPLYETVMLLGGEGFPVRFGWLNAS
jgi:septum formation protein